MNQAIQFPDREYFDPELNAVCFPVMVNGVNTDRILTHPAKVKLTHPL